MNRITPELKEIAVRTVISLFCAIVIGLAAFLLIYYMPQYPELKIVFIIIAAIAGFIGGYVILKRGI